MVKVVVYYYSWRKKFLFLVGNWLIVCAKMAAAFGATVQAKNGNTMQDKE